MAISFLGLEMRAIAASAPSEQREASARVRQEDAMRGLQNLDPKNLGPKNLDPKKRK